MRIGIPKEIKNSEYRVGLTPPAVHEFVERGHEVFAETQVGVGIRCSDARYQAAGAKIVGSASEIFEKSELIIKVKEPQKIERKMLREGQILFAYLHLAPDREQTQDLLESGAVCIAYETVTNQKGGLPLLAPMSQVAGRLSIQAGATSLEMSRGGAGILLGGVPGVEPARVVIIGGGVVGENAVLMALGMAADVTILDRNVEILNRLSNRFGAALKTIYSTHAAVESHVINADLVIGAVLVAGATAPKLVTADLVKKMKPGSVLVDVAIDQGGCFETSTATTHAEPTYIVDGVVHYCVANMPGAVPLTSTYALTNAILPHALALAQKGCRDALLDDKNLLNGLNIYKGVVTQKAVAHDLGYDYIDPQSALTSS